MNIPNNFEGILNLLDTLSPNTIEFEYFGAYFENCLNIFRQDDEEKKTFSNEHYETFCIVNKIMEKIFEKVDACSITPPVSPPCESLLPPPSSPNDLGKLKNPVPLIYLFSFFFLLSSFFSQKKTIISIR